MTRKYQPKLSFDLSGTTAPPAIPLNDPERDRKIANWKRELRNADALRRRRNLDVEEFE